MANLECAPGQVFDLYFWSFWGKHHYVLVLSTEVFYSFLNLSVIRVFIVRPGSHLRVFQNIRFTWDGQGVWFDYTPAQKLWFTLLVLAQVLSRSITPLLRVH
ncbi:hypothetical protein BD769DRAFT_1388292 [Suillus cothurnatus]|nr:hypothetical protein BD769DRAFT_1388292 [Suillus cothurnatus]